MKGITYIAKRSRTLVGPNDIIAIANLAKKDKKAGNKIINASIGSFLDENGKLGDVPVVDDALKENITADLSYGPSSGDPSFREAVIDWIFTDRRPKLESLYSVFSGASIGGTGALFNAFSLFLEEGDSVLLPDILWTNYTLLARKAGLKSQFYSLFDKDRKFNILSVKENIEALAKKQNHVFFLLNDPCQNPTGYCLSEEEYDALFSMLEEEGKKTDLIVLFDIAYLDYYNVNGHHCALVDKLLEKKADFLPLISFSCSKLFGLYGLRVGALLALAPNPTEKDEIQAAYGSQARGTYSVPVCSAEVAVCKAMEDKGSREKLLSEVEANKLLLSKRSEEVVLLLKEYGFDFYPYSSGFFITLVIQNAFPVFEAMKKQHMYVVPLDENHIRLAVSGLSLADAKVLIPALKKAAEENK